MAARNTNPRRTSGFAWGPQRVALGLSLKELASLSGVSKSALSMAEAGRLVPTGEQYGKVMEALRAHEAALPEDTRVVLDIE